MTRFQSAADRAPLTIPEKSELSFRRGFRQGAEALAHALGCSLLQFRRSTWNRRIQRWQLGDLSKREKPPHWPTPDELRELRSMTSGKEAPTAGAVPITHRPSAEEPTHWPTPDELDALGALGALDELRTMTTRDESTPARAGAMALRPSTEEPHQWPTPDELHELLTMATAGEPPTTGAGSMTRRPPAHDRFTVEISTAELVALVTSLDALQGIGSPRYWDGIARCYAQGHRSLMLQQLKQRLKQSLPSAAIRRRRRREARP
jgi:hypothetical protein